LREKERDDQFVEFVEIVVLSTVMASANGIEFGIADHAVFSFTVTDHHQGFCGVAVRWRVVLIWVMQCLQCES
jgi:hypothetical protein